MRRATIVVIAMLAVGLLALPAQAGRSGGDYIQPSCWWDPAVSTGCDATGTARTAAPQVGNLITFDFQSRYVDTTNGTGPWLQLQCFRAGADFQYEGQLSGVMILADSRAGFPGGRGYGRPFELDGTSWHLGPANCVTQVGHVAKNGRFSVDASTSFSVTG